VSTNTAGVHLAAFFPVLLAPRRERNDPLVQLLAANPERVLLALFGAGGEAVE
jgi:hypothetical protein